ncbi:MAG: O-antigen ligase family protein [Proteobacteria bacterium]|nr:O-antigen ligase family protein [Pseudomonadota bacterium]
MNQRHTTSDWILVLSVLTGLYSAAGLAGILLAVLVRGEFVRLRLRIYHAALGAAACWALYVVSQRGMASLQGQLPYLAFLWTLPFLMACYRPDAHTVHAFRRMLLALFAVDLLFNLYSLVFGADLLGRTVDMRAAVLGARHGGLFAHSFYSGAISITALISLMDKVGLAKIVLALPLANLVLAGSWRLLLAIPLLFLFRFIWRYRSRLIEICLVGVASVALVWGVFSTSAFSSIGIENDSNSFRVISWVLALEKITSSPWTGVGVPNVAAVREQGVSVEVLDENFIGESSYLNTALSFGIPYAVLFLLAFFIAFWGENYRKRTMQMAVLFPYVAVDMVYGDFFSGVLTSCWLWLLISSIDTTVESPTKGDR